MNIIDRLLEHNTWATRALVERCRTLSPQQFTQRFEIGPGSLHDTLLHVIGAMRRWTDRLLDRPLRPRVEDEKTPRSPHEMLDLLDEAAADLIEVSRKLKSDRRINDLLEMPSTRHNRPIRFTYGTAIVHVATHGVHHRAQCLNMLRRLGVADLPDLDAIEWEVVAQPAIE